MLPSYREKSKTLKLCLKNVFREFSWKILFRFSKNLTSSKNSQKSKIHLFTSLNMQQDAISQKEIVFRFRKDIQSEKGCRFDILCMRSPGVKGICADALLCGLSLLLVLVPAPRVFFFRPCSEGFSPGSPVFLPPQKPTLQIPIRSGNEGHGFVSFAVKCYPH